VSVYLAVPGGKAAVNREPGEDHAHEDIYVAIHDAFDAARRGLQDHVRHLDGQMKQHAAPSIGRIVRVFAERDYGFLERATATRFTSIATRLSAVGSTG
jgi:hypothetical protein